MSLTEFPDGWESRGSIPTLFKRFEFDNYHETRAFLDALAALTEEAGLHPQNINFASTYVNITLDANDEGKLGEDELSLATRINQLFLNKSD
ncbi:4a-hydroxytetrahydrobiopterin dehydratase [Nitrosomonas sp.]|uniref:4a-hydroxytetrahydrobiopterin dehydratase n=1 Tax=Nitrosomonas sp. TaxID=42353 RepID=UPI0028526D57|nr:4a-hydroxytetrahydrobiopterin dehydratase [Nitrosomonas sp.]